MSTVLHPVGPQPDRVYWVRRIVVLALLVVAASLVFSFVRGAMAPASAGDDPGESTGEVPVAPADAVTDPADAVTDPAVGPVACAPADLTVALTTDARSYAAGAPVAFSVAVTNTGAGACVVDAADAQREVVITSGTDRIWSSLDCPVDGTEQLHLLESGARVDSAITWARTRSATDCPADLPEPQPGTYSAVATTHGATSAAAVFDLG